MQYVSEATAEGHYMLLGILLRPLHLPVPAASTIQQDVPMTEQERVLEAYGMLCTAPNNEAPWPAAARSSEDMGPLEHRFSRRARGASA